ncbi:MAG: hypothetical protein GXO03_02340 [Aquificae bacterium]|nr:hypothetical protein [Aquificota bacterium]
MRGLVLLFSLLLFSFAQELKLEGAITDISHAHGKAAVSTEWGKVYLIDLNAFKVEAEITVPDITDFTGEKQSAKVFSVDISPSGSKLAIAAEANLGKRTVFIYENGQLKPLLEFTDASKVRFLDENRLIIATLANEIWLYDLKNHKTVYKYLVFRFVFSDMDINEDRTLVAWGDESGKVFFIDPETGRVIGVGTEGNKDKIFSVSFGNKVVMSGGRDKKAVVYYLDDRITGRKSMRENLDDPSLLKDVHTRFINRSLEFVVLPRKVFQSDFMVFAVAVSPDDYTGAYTSDEEGRVSVFKMGLWDEKKLDAGCYVNVIDFISRDRLLIGCIDGRLVMREVKP